MPKETIPFKRTHFELIGSTQDHLIENASNLLKENNQVVITANEQTKGRGTANRMWASPPHVNIYATFGVKIPNDFGVYFDLAKSPAVMELMALAVVKTLEELGFEPVIKWRNDVLINGKKVCGILCEATTSTQGGVGLIGIGLNVNMPKEICESLDQPVTSLAVEAGHTLDKEKVFNLLAKNVDHYINIYLKQEFKHCVPEINARLAFIGKLIHIEDQFSHQVLEGVCLGIDEVGQLKIKINENDIRLVRWGRIVKDELTYPEAFAHRKENIAPQQNHDIDILPLAISLLGAGGLAYWIFYRNSENMVTKKPEQTSSSSSQTQAQNKRHFSTLVEKNRAGYFFDTRVSNQWLPTKHFLNNYAAFCKGNGLLNKENSAVRMVGNNIKRIFR